MAWRRPKIRGVSILVGYANEAPTFATKRRFDAVLLERLQRRAHRLRDLVVLQSAFDQVFGLLALRPARSARQRLNHPFGFTRDLQAKRHAGRSYGRLEWPSNVFSDHLRHPC